MWRRRMMGIGLLCCGVSSTAAVAEPIPLSAEEYGLYRAYESALLDSRVLKMPAERRLPAIARNFRVREDVLSAAVTKGNRYGPTLGPDCEHEIRAQLAKCALAERLREVHVDATSSHVIAYVTWTAQSKGNLDADATLVASVVFGAAPVIHDLGLSAVDSTTGRDVFHALVPTQWRTSPPGDWDLQTRTSPG